MCEKGGGEWGGTLGEGDNRGAVISLVNDLCLVDWCGYKASRKEHLAS